MTYRHIPYRHMTYRHMTYRHTTYRHMTYRHMHRQKSISKYTYIYSFFILCIEFHVARMQTEFCRNCPKHIRSNDRSRHYKVYPGWQRHVNEGYGRNNDWAKGESEHLEIKYETKCRKEKEIRDGRWRGQKSGEEKRENKNF